MFKPSECRLRSMAAHDLERVLRWRNSERIRHAMFQGNIISVEEHTAWFGRQQDRADVVYLIFEHRDRPLGLVNFTRIDPARGSCYWGFYIGEEEAPPGAGTAMGCLALDYAFGSCGWREVIGEALVSNPGSIAYHRKLGFSDEKLLRAHVEKNGKMEDAMGFTLTPDEWAQARAAVFAAVFEPQEVGS